MKAKLITKTGKIKGDIDLPKLFEVTPNKEILTLYTKIYLANQRQANAHTKGRGEVAGSTRKLYKQKGTGNARRGSLRSPIMRGGGIVFGPKNTVNYKRTLPKSQRKLAMLGSIALKGLSENLFVSQVFDIKSSVKDYKKMISNLGLVGKVMFVLPEMDTVLVKVLKGLPKTDVILVNELSAYDVLNTDNLILHDNVLTLMEERFATKSKIAKA